MVRSMLPVLLVLLAGCLDPAPSPLEVTWRVTNEAEGVLEYEVRLDGDDTHVENGSLAPGQSDQHVFRVLGDEVSATAQAQGENRTVVLHSTCQTYTLGSTWNGTWSTHVEDSDCPI